LLLLAAVNYVQDRVFVSTNFIIYIVIFMENHIEISGFFSRVGKSGQPPRS